MPYAYDIQLPYDVLFLLKHVLLPEDQLQPVLVAPSAFCIPLYVCSLCHCFLSSFSVFLMLYSPVSLGHSVKVLKTFDLCLKTLNV